MVAILFAALFVCFILQFSNLSVYFYLSITFKCGLLDVCINHFRKQGRTRFYFVFIIIIFLVCVVVGMGMIYFEDCSFIVLYQLLIICILYKKCMSIRYVLLCELLLFIEV